MIKLLIFDLDGTLIHSAPDIIRTTNQLMRARGKPLLPQERIIAAIGEGLKQTVFSLFPETHSDHAALEELEREFFQYYEENLLVSTDVFPGVDDFLQSCDKRIAIVTNKHERLAKKVVNSLSLNRYDWLRVFGADSLPNRKPDPLPLNEVMRIAGVDRSETLMIGDGIPDMIAARRAGVHSIAIEFGYTKLEILEAQGASLTLPSYAELPRIIEEASTLPPRDIETA